MKPDETKWFPARSPENGWGWGLPTCWQGWAVLAGYAILVAVGGILIPFVGIFAFLLFCFVVTAGLIAILRRKGENPDAPHQ